MADGSTFRERDVRREVLTRAWVMRHVAHTTPGAEGQLLRTIHTSRLDAARRMNRDRRRAIRDRMQ